MLSVVNNDGTTETGSLMDDIVREGAQRMLAAALEAEVNQYIAELAGERDEIGRRLVVRNGHHRERTVTITAGPVAVKAPRVNDRRVDVEFPREHCPVEGSLGRHHGTAMALPSDFSEGKGGGGVCTQLVRGDHVHLLVYYPPKIALSKLVNSLKGVSSRYLRAEYTGRINRIGMGSVFWAPSYFVGSCGGAPLSIVQNYIENQKRPT